MEVENVQPELVRVATVRSTNSSQNDDAGPPEPEMVAVMIHQHDDGTVPAPIHTEVDRHVAIHHANDRLDADEIRIVPDPDV